VNSLLELSDVSIAYNGKAVVTGASLGLRQFEIGCLLGPSGCGKTTLLRAVGGFEPVTTGDIRINKQLMSRPGFSLAPEKRGIGMVFQDFALFPHLSVADNIAFGIRHYKWQEQTRRVHALLNLIGLPDSAKRYPHELSGGQQQRIALARALAPRPQLLLLDEPFSSLDVELRESLATEIRQILKEEGITGLLVTHDQHEAFAMADQVGVMSDGRLLQWDTAYNLYHQPAERFVADFIGHGVFLPGRVLNEKEVETELAVIEGKVPPGCRTGCPVEVLVRPDDILHDDCSPRSAEVAERAFRGSHFLYRLRLGSGAEVLCLTPSHHDHPIGTKLGIRLEIDHLVVFPGKPQSHGTRDNPGRRAVDRPGAHRQPDQGSQETDRSHTAGE
jgi:iron(III) transport system ATP-binding protein